MNRPCEEFADRIVDYVDGELPEAEAQVVARHLAVCEPCRRTVGALNQSLRLAKTIWADNLGDVQTVPAKKFHPIRFYAVAASVLVAVSILVLTVSDRHPERSSIHVEELEWQVARAGAAAELLAATQILARCEGAEVLVERQYQFILREYAGTPAAESIRARLSPESRRYTQ